MSTGTIVLGLLNGLTTGLLAIGLVLVYRANRFLNLAHAQMGTLSALLVAKWVVDWHWSFWLAFPLAILVGAVIGLAVDRFVVGRLRRRGGTPVRLLLLSVAVSQVLLAFTFVPHLSPRSKGASLYPQPFTSRASIGHVVLSGMTVLTAIVVPLLTVVLAAFLRFTGLGKAIRAAANNPDAARLCGIPVARVSAITWAIAGGLSAVSAVLQAPNQASFNAAALGPYLLMLTLGAAAFGAFVSIPAALGGGIVLGLVSQIVSAERASSADAELAVFATVLLVVLVRGRQIGRVLSLQGGIGDALRPLRVPTALQGNPVLRRPILWTAPLTLLLAVALPTLPYFRTEAHRFLLVLVLLYALIGVGLTMLVGWAGQVSLGHFALVGLGAYLAARWGAHWSLLALVVVAGLIGAAVMAAIGLPALRVGGLALAVTTTGLAVISPDWLFQQSWVGSADPFVTVPKIRLGFGLGTPQSMFALYFVALVALILAVAAAASLRRYGPGRLVIAVRDNEPAASAFGLNPPTVKLAILAVSGFFAAAAGVLWADTWGVISTPQFTPELSVGIIAIPIIGGLGSVSGAVAAAVALYMTTFFVGPHVAGLFGSFGHELGFQLFLAGVTEIGVLLQAPRGIAGVVQQRWQAFLDRRALLVDRWSAPVPSTEAEATGSAGPPVPTEAMPVAGTAPVVRAGRNGSVPVLAVDGALVRFGGITALDRPVIAVQAHEIVGLIGPNGAGKTTLMNVISGVLRPSGASVRIAGREVGDLPAAYRAAYGLARTFQDARLFGGLTVTETVQVALAYRHKVGIPAAMVAAPWARAEESTTALAAERIIERFGLTPWAHTLTGELSTGTRRICDLAAQVAAAPQVLLLDEPTAGVAQREAEAFGPLLRRIRDELDCAVLIVEHDMPLLMGLCDRVYAMESGRVIAEGTPEEIRANPDVVASYLGSRSEAVARSGARAGAPGRRRPARAAARTRSRTVATPEPILRVEHLDFSYATLPVLFDVSLHVEPGEALALLGTNGAGKSTLLRAIAGLEAPQAGSVVLDGRDVTAAPAERIVELGLVLVTGGRGVFTDMTVEENLQMQARTLRRQRAVVRERRDRVLATFPLLAERLTQQAGSLSGGEQQQLALAKALMLAPRVLCIDELSLGLAPVVVGELMETVSRIHDSGVAVVVVEQSLNIAAQLCQRAVFMEKGGVRFEGPTADLLERDDIARAVFLGETA